MSDSSPKSDDGLDLSIEDGSSARTPLAGEPRFVIGLGASAGGLEAMAKFFARVKLDAAAYVVMQHQPPDHASLLASLLERASPLQARNLEDGMALQANVVYVVPSHARVSFEHGVARFAGVLDGARLHLPIDACFRALAADRGPTAIGVVLSGTGTDGTFGLSAIKAAGGLTFAQDPETAAFDGMPRSALDSGAAELALAPDAIADEIMRITTQLHAGATPEMEFQEHLGKLAVLLRNAFGIELTNYKPKTIERRVQRRMAVRRTERFLDYIKLCQQDPKELGAFYRDLLINVTSFFRDREPFRILKEGFLSELVDAKRDGEALRVWVPGCASGKEAYSIAMLLLELCDERGRNLKIQIFGTDVDGEAIQQARRGAYAANIAADVPPEQLRQFFSPTDDDRYQISRRVRDLIVFSTQNIVKDAPFSKLDLVSCRNLLIYLQPSVQKKVLRILHYALRANGGLLLGTSESVGESSELFTLIDRKNKLYQARHASTHGAVLEAVGVDRNVAPAEVAPRAMRPMVSIAHLADRKILEEYAPPGVVVNEQLDILYYRGRTAAYLEQPSGVSTHNILRLIRPELHPVLKQLIEQASHEHAMVSGDGQVRHDGGFRGVTIIVQPLLEPETRAQCLLILFKDAKLAVIEPTSPIMATAGENRALAQELALTKDYLQSTIDELERANEDLKSANEELQSANEELQSTNEELGTSKEELQSSNEELITVNEELQNRMRDLSTAKDDLYNVLLGVDRAVVIVGLDLRIRRYNLSAEKILNLVATDVGRSASLLDQFIGGAGIAAVISDTIEQVTAVEREILATDRRWYRLRVLPYKTQDLTIRGAVLTFADIEVPKRRAELTRLVEEYATSALAERQDALAIVNRDQKVIWANPAYLELIQTSLEEIVGTKLTEHEEHLFGAPELQALIGGAFALDRPFRDHPVEAVLAHAGRQRLLVSGSRIRTLATESLLLLVSLTRDAGGRP